MDAGECRPSHQGTEGLESSDSRKDPTQNGAFSTELDDLNEALHSVGLEACELIIGIDFTMSNRHTGRNSFDGRCLHEVGGHENPYLKVLKFIARTLPHLDDDSKIPCYGFGDGTTEGNAVFCLYPDNVPAQGLNSVVKRYKQIAPRVDLAGPTSFAPLIYQAMKDVFNSDMKFHILLIIADGQISDECLEVTRRAILDAVLFPLSIVVIGVGDGPWEEMKDFDDGLPQREWDNFQFVEFNKVIAITEGAHMAEEKQEEEFAKSVLEELPEQYVSARELTGRDKKRDVAHLINTIPLNCLINPPQYFD